MKAQRRKQLKHHDLADGLETAFRWSRQHTNVALLLAVLLAAAAIGGGYLFSRRGSAGEQAWTGLALAGQNSDPAAGLAQLEKLARTTSNRTVAALALLRIGDRLYYQSRLPIGRDRASPEQKLAQARQSYQRVLEEYGDQTLAVAGARFSLAAIAEDAGDFEAADRQYEAIERIDPLDGSVFVTMAKSRRQQLAGLDSRIVFAGAPAAADDSADLPAATQPAAP